MARKICVCLEFLEPHHEEQLRQAAEAAGYEIGIFTPYMPGSSQVSIGADEQLEAAKAFVADPECEILFAHSPALLRAATAGLKWYCCSFAGVDPYCTPEGQAWFANPNCLLSNSSGAYDQTIAEHLVMVTLMMLRQMPAYSQIVQQRGWRNQLPVRSLLGSRVTVLGAGSIGTAFAAKARALGAARVTGVSRSGVWHTAPEGPCGTGPYDELISFDRLDEVLPVTGVLVMALPGTPETNGLLDARRIALLPANAVVANVGRGSAIDQEALAEALQEGRLAGAALDVMTPEPLPETNPLWNVPNLILTPHVSGNMTLGYTRDECVRLFLEDFDNYLAGRPLRRLVSRDLGY